MDFTGDAKLATFGYELGVQAASQPKLIGWVPGDEFEAARQKNQPLTSIIRRPPKRPKRPAEEVQPPFVLELKRTGKVRFKLQFSGQVPNRLRYAIFQSNQKTRTRSELVAAIAIPPRVL